MITLNVGNLLGTNNKIKNCHHLMNLDHVRNYVEKQFDAYLTGETRVNRLGQKSSDTRVHACLYFISPVGHGLKPLDLEFMKMLQDSINIIPVIAKADTFTVKEQNIFKHNVSKV